MVDKWMAEVWTQDSWLSEKEVRLKGGMIYSSGSYGSW
jgi:hypothetical protein